MNLRFFYKSHYSLALKTRWRNSADNCWSHFKVENINQVLEHFRLFIGVIIIYRYQIPGTTAGDNNII